MMRGITTRKGTRQEASGIAGGFCPGGTRKRRCLRNPDCHEYVMDSCDNWLLSRADQVYDRIVAPNRKLNHYLTIRYTEPNPVLLLTWC
jgi:hypothetical protein